MDDDLLVVERDAEPGGYCRTVEQDGFVWDYSGHFFHFRRPEIERWLVERMPPGAVRTVAKRTRVRPTPDAPDRETAFPFQTHTHELPKDDFLACLAGLVGASRGPGEAHAATFKQMLAARFGEAICEKFLVPYNEKLYATDLDTLDRDAMGRFFPRGGLEEALTALSEKSARDTSYNASFTYPRRGAVEYVRALLADLPSQAVALEEPLVSIDLARRIATTTKRQISFEHLVTSAPLPVTLSGCGVPFDAGAFTSNQVLVFNLGFDKKGRSDVHWLYFADPSLSFYRVGFYDNIHGDARMSLYVEVGQPAGAPVDLELMRVRVLDDLIRARIVTTQKLVAWHAVVMNPAYVHIHARSVAEATRARTLLAAHGVHSIGRYGAWTYCSIEDNIVEARALAARLLQTL